MISIIIICYNIENYLEDCLESVFGQTICDYEIVLVDDGSTDGTAAICMRVAEQRPGLVTLVRQHNLGRWEARKAGLRAARGEYVMFLDGDDMLRHDAVSVISQELSVFPYDLFAFCSCKNETFSEDDFTRFLRSGFKSVKSVNDLKANLVSTDFFYGICLFAVKRRCLDAYRDERDCIRLNRSEDRLATIIAADCADSFGSVGEVLHYYVRRNSSITNTVVAPMIMDAKIYLTVLSMYANRWGLSSQEGSQYIKWGSLLVSQSFAYLSSRGLKDEKRRVYFELHGSTFLCKMEKELVKYRAPCRLRLRLALLRTSPYCFIICWLHLRMRAVQLLLTLRTKAYLVVG